MEHVFATMDSPQENFEKVLENSVASTTTKTRLSVECEFIEYLKLRVEYAEERNQYLQRLLHQYLPPPVGNSPSKRESS